jgi:aerobic-type carbon monoxide dehydrogenase small subunit (CoxS/CutS family)
MSQVELNINRTFYSLDVHADMPLLCLLRDKLNLVGTRQGTRSI